MRATFHGVRGSTPCHGSEIARYGGNTSCVSVEIPGAPPILFDLGTGVRYFGLGQAHDGSFRGVCLLSHLHWDHIQGLPFFTPMLVPGSRLDVYAPAQHGGRTVAEEFERVIAPPAFPVHLSRLPGTFGFHDLADDEFDIGDVHVTARHVPHVGPTLGYRLDWNGRSVAYISDHQQPFDGSMGLTEGALELASGVDVLIHDSQYLTDEFAAKHNWGHCTVDFAVSVAVRAGARTLVLFHHDPLRCDEAVDALTRTAAAAAAEHGIEVIAAREGLTLGIG